MKYKPCCNKICCLGSCEVQAQGGCYCLCRLKDYESQLIDLIEGECHRNNGCVIYKPGLKITPNAFEKENDEKELKKVREKIKEYEIC